MEAFSSQNIESIKCVYIKFPLPFKAKEVHFKTIKNIYPCKEFLNSKFNIGDNECVFCANNIETKEHLFFNCIFTNIFWDSFCIWGVHNNLIVSSLKYVDTKFGLALENKDKNSP